MPSKKQLAFDTMTDHVVTMQHTIVIRPVDGTLRYETECIQCFDEHRIHAEPLDGE